MTTKMMFGVDSLVLVNDNGVWKPGIVSYVRDASVERNSPWHYRVVVDGVGLVFHKSDVKLDYGATMARTKAAFTKKHGMSPLAFYQKYRPKEAK